MKILLSIVFVLAFVKTIVAQSFNEPAYKDQHKTVEGFATTTQDTSALLVPPLATEKAIKLRNAGRALTFIGIAEIVVAGAMGLSTLGQTTTTTCNPCTIPQATTQDQVEGVLVVAGLTTTITGIVLWRKGNHRMKDSSLSFHWNGNGGVLRYRF
jgi:hypothetical protein